jgi:hypothetical protein
VPPVVVDADHPARSAGCVFLRVAGCVLAASVLAAGQSPVRREISGVYPHLAMFNARHLTRPPDAIYLATMEKGLYEVDVRTLGVRQLHEDANMAERRKAGRQEAYIRQRYESFRKNPRRVSSRSCPGANRSSCHCTFS